MRKARVLLIHNYYQEAGGEDAVFVAERDLLRRHGHDVVEYTDDNHRIASMAAWVAAGRAMWSSSSYEAVKALISSEKPDIVHFHNTFLLVSPAAYYACARMGVPSVQTLHNYRVICPNGLLLRGGKVCENCIGRLLAWPAVIHACYRGSRSESAVVAAMLATHRAMGTWQRKVGAYIALTKFGRDRFIRGGLPAERIMVKPHFVEDPGPADDRDGHAVYVGRLSQEKGIRIVLDAWEHLGGVPLAIVGTGPLQTLVDQSVARGRIDAVTAGTVAHADAMRAIQDGTFLVFPSVCYESFGRTIIEAFACGRPVVASRLGAAEEIVEDGVTGLHFNPGDPMDLAAKVRWLWEHPEECTRMGENARREYEQKYTPERNYAMLMDIYSKTISEYRR